MCDVFVNSFTMLIGITVVSPTGRFATVCLPTSRVDSPTSSKSVRLRLKLRTMTITV